MREGLVSAAVNRCAFQFGERGRNVDFFGAGFHAVKDQVTAPQAVGAVDDIDAFSGSFVAGIGNKAPGFEQRCWAKVAFVFPEAWARGRAAAAENTFGRVINFCLFDWVLTMRSLTGAGVLLMK